jgi:hypothetical protein
MDDAAAAIWSAKRDFAPGFRFARRSENRSPRISHHTMPDAGASVRRHRQAANQTN